jgi:hypothetical protein
MQREILFAAHCGPDPERRTEKPGSPAVWALEEKSYATEDFVFFEDSTPSDP